MNDTAKSAGAVDTHSSLNAMAIKSTGTPSADSMTLTPATNSSMSIDPVSNKSLDDSINNPGK